MKPILFKHRAAPNGAGRERVSEGADRIVAAIAFAWDGGPQAATFAALKQTGELRSEKIECDESSTPAIFVCRRTEPRMRSFRSVDDLGNVVIDVASVGVGLVVAFDHLLAFLLAVRL